MSSVHEDLRDRAMYDISPETVLKAAQEKYGSGVRVSCPYFVDHEVVRVGVTNEAGDISFGANFFFKDGVFR